MKAFFFDSIYNTQEFALEELNSEPILVISFHQEKGKGTSNRSWLNADQSLACSLAFNKDDSKLDETLIPLLSGLCFTEVLSESPIFLKWPNDLILNKFKCGGILIENISSKADNHHILAIGIGVNLIKSPLRTTFPSSSIYDETNVKIDPYKFLLELNKNIVKKIDYWNYGLNYKAILEKWIEKAYLLNKEISVTLPNGKKEKGIFSSIDNEGGLILSTKKSDKVFYAAEIFEGL